MHRFLVIEAKRLLPLLFLLVLLVSLSIYDNFFRVDRPVIGPEEETPDYSLTFITAGQGLMEGAASFQVIETQEQWLALREGHPFLPDYPFNADYELAVSAINGEVDSINLFPRADGQSQVQVKVSKLPGSFHVVTVEKAHLESQSQWLFLDTEGNLLQEFMLGEAALPGGMEEEK